MTTKNFKTLHTFKTLYNADSVEWCPIPSFQTYFVCGTYQLVDTSQSNRKGSVLLFHVTKEALQIKAHMETSAVLDMKWCPHVVGVNIVLGVACSDGDINIFYLSDGVLKFVTKYCLKKKENHLILSLDWCNVTGDEIICASDSAGDITLLKFINSSLEIWKQWNAHGLEAWTASFDLHNPNLLFSGGDDCKLNAWDLRSEKCHRVGGTNAHRAGVTALSCRPSIQFSLLSGSYDETISMWDTRNWDQPIRVIIADGGLWRLKWEPVNEPRYLLAACIYGGFEIFEPYDSSSVVGRYKEHESLAYGADWCRCPGRNLSLSNEQYLISTCSFYDQKVCVSVWDKSQEFVDS